MVEPVSYTHLLFVVTNKPDAQARKIMKALYGEGLFERVCGQTGRFPVKPDPSLTLSLLEEAGLSPDQAAFVGDSGVDMETAHNAGMRAVGVLWGFRGEAELSDAGADCLAASPEELPTLLLSLIHISPCLQHFPLQRAGTADHGHDHHAAHVDEFPAAYVCLDVSAEMCIRDRKHSGRWRRGGPGEP